MEKRILINGKYRTQKQCNELCLFLFKITVKRSIVEHFQRIKEEETNARKLTKDEMIQKLESAFDDFARKVKKGD